MTTDNTQHERTQRARRLAREGRDLVATPSAFSRLAFAGALERSEDLLPAVERYAGKLSEGGPLGRETFARMLDARGLKPLPEGERSDFGVRALNACEEIGAWPELCAAARCHPGIATEQTADVLNSIADILGIDKLPDDDGNAADPRDAAQRAQAAEKIDGMAQDAIEAMRRAARKSAARREAVLANLEQAKISGALSEAIGEARDKAQAQAEAVGMLRGCGLGAEAGGDPGAIPFDLVKSLAGDPLFKKILSLAGRMRDASRAADNAKAHGMAGEIVGVTTGGNVASLLPVELARLAGPLRLDVIHRMQNGTALVWEYKADKPQDRGPVALLQDQSSSMVADDRFVFSRALTVALLTTAHAQKRLAVLVAFAGKGDVRSIVVRPGDEKGLQDAIRLACVPPHGGTDVPGALRELRRVTAPIPDADCVMITDACFPAPPRADVRAACGADGRLFVVGLGDGARLSMPDADRVWAIADNPTEDNATEIMAGLFEEK